MPIFFTRKLNAATLALFQYIDAEGENGQELAQLLEASKTANIKIETRANAINFLARVDIKGTKHGVTFKQMTCLDVVILKNKNIYFELLTKFIFIDNHLHHSNKKTLFVSAIAVCCASYHNKMLAHLLIHAKGKLNLNVTNHAWEFRGTNLPLNIAVLTGNEKATSLLLSHGANTSIVDKRGLNAQFYLNKIDDLEKRKKISEMLGCKDYITAAERAYHRNDALQTYTLFANAIHADLEQAREFIARITQQAIAQQNPVSIDIRDYRFILEFIRIFTGILSSPLANETQRDCYKNFQHETAVFLFGAYDCNAPASGPKLFKTTEEKISFFINFGYSSLFHQSDVEKSIQTMTEKKYYQPFELARKQLTAADEKATAVLSLTRRPV